MMLKNEQATLLELIDSDTDSLPYLKELGIKLVDLRMPIQFSNNKHLPVHRWSPYVQGFSADFVYSVLLQYWHTHSLGQSDCLVYDPFAGVGTALVEAKRLGIRRCMGTELNPLLAFLANGKLQAWNIEPSSILEAWDKMDRSQRFPAPSFLRSKNHFQPEVLCELEILGGGVDWVHDEKTRDLLKVAFASILIDCSNLKRSPCLGYCANKHPRSTPWNLMKAKVAEIAEDLELLKNEQRYKNNVFAHVEVADAKVFRPPPLTLVVTSPPYMNGLDYIMNYKIEMAWLGFLNSYHDSQFIKSQMIACDNVSPRVIADFAQQERYNYSDRWLANIIERISYNVEHWDEGHAQRRIPRRHKLSLEKNNKHRYRRRDMPLIVHKYFDDMYQVMEKLTGALLPRGRIILVLGDSLIADVYVPTDLIIAKMGLSLGLELESILKARTRRSGQIRSYKLRESVITLRKPN
jgi:hypothetical protein